VEAALEAHALDPDGNADVQVLKNLEKLRLG